MNLEPPRGDLHGGVHLRRGRHVPPMNELIPALLGHKRVTSKASALSSQHYRSIIQAMGHIGERNEAPRFSTGLQQTAMRTLSFSRRGR